MVDHRTRPDAWDTDEGGESDGSEVAAGRDPLAQADDRPEKTCVELMPTPAPGATPAATSKTTPKPVPALEAKLPDTVLGRPTTKISMDRPDRLDFVFGLFDALLACTGKDHSDLRLGVAYAPALRNWGVVAVEIDGVSGHDLSDMWFFRMSRGLTGLGFTDAEVAGRAYRQSEVGWAAYAHRRHVLLGHVARLRRLPAIAATRPSRRRQDRRGLHRPAAARPLTAYPAATLQAMKGIVLAGGTATRLFPLTIVTNKHLLPIYDRPMIYYPIETLAGMGIREVMVVIGGKSVGDVVELLADGSHFGLDLTYRYQPGALGIAHAIGLARDFVGDDAFCCVLGDNILRGAPLADVAAEFEDGPYGAGTLLYRVPDPERFGVAELDADGNVVAFEEKPDRPKSDLIPIGVYFLRPDAFHVIDGLPPSGRGEFEITDVLNHYIPLRSLFSRIYEGHWTDAGTVPSLLRAAELAAEDDAAGRLQPPVTRSVG